MAAAERFVPRFAAEPPQEALPYGRWAERLSQEFLAACLEVEDAPEDLGEPQEINWYPDRTWHGRTYVPATAMTAGGYELFGYVRFVAAEEDGEPRELLAKADFTDETAEQNPEWKLDICDEVIGSWRGEGGAIAAMTLVWGRPLIGGGTLIAAHLGDVMVDQCPLIEGRFTIIAPDNFRHDLLDIVLLGSRDRELARESLYVGEGEGEEE